MLAIPLALALLTSVPFALAGPTFVGCYTAVQGTIYGSSGADNQADCLSDCVDIMGNSRPGQITYAFWSEGALACRCSTGGPFQSLDFQESRVVSAPNVPSCATSAHYSSFRLGTTFEFEQCSFGQFPSRPRFQAASLNECFDTCRGARGVYIMHQPSVAFLDCACMLPSDVGLSTGSTTACRTGNDRHFRYTHTAAAASGRLNRRQRSRATRDDDYCPGKSTACTIPGTSSYECIDTMTELESCGGCVYGEFSVKTKHEPKGVNCDSLNGRSFRAGTTTCQAGHCVRG